MLWMATASSSSGSMCFVRITDTSGTRAGKTIQIFALTPGFRQTNFYPLPYGIAVGSSPQSTYHHSPRQISDPEVCRDAPPHCPYGPIAGTVLHTCELENLIHEKTQPKKPSPRKSFQGQPEADQPETIQAEAQSRIAGNSRPFKCRPARCTSGRTGGPIRQRCPAP